MRHIPAVAAGLLFGLGPAAWAQEADIGAGATYAKQVCALCHAVLPNEHLAPGSDLPESG
jgi:mono/diheme cytochrome c family protein